MDTHSSTNSPIAEGAKSAALGKPPTRPPRGQGGLRDSLTLRLFVVGVLVLLLGIPLLIIRFLIEERDLRQTSAAQEIADIWGQPQTLAGPLLVIPFQYQIEDDKGKIRTATDQQVFLPSSLQIEADLDPEIRSRGIYEVAVYRTSVDLKGSFRNPILGPAPSGGEWQWEQAYLALGLPDLRGFSNASLASNGTALELEPGGQVLGIWSSGIRIPLGSAASTTARKAVGIESPTEAEIPFDGHFEFRGSRELSVIPMGETTTVTMRSPWSSPSFRGAFLPDSRTITETGFEAQWSVAQFGRGFAQSWILGGRDAPPQYEVDRSAFGVELLLEVDAYQKTARAVKYGLLFVVLTFLTFFLFEAFHPLALHVLHYLLVGAALCVFYLLLLSISEHLPFSVAYSIAAAATVMLISSYSAAVLRTRGRAVILGSILGSLYGFLFALLAAQDYALLLGSIGLFLVLGLLMWFTRRIDWYRPRSQQVPAPESA